MASSQADSAEEAGAVERPRRRFGRFVRLLVLGLVVAGAIATGVSFWQDRTLNKIEQTLEQGNVAEANRLVSVYLITHPRNVRAQVLLARTLVARQQPLEAIQILTQVGAASTAELHALARAYMMLEQWSDAEPRLAQIVARDGTNADALYELTTCRVRLGMFEQAVESATRLAQLPGNKARGYVYLGTIQTDRKNFQKAAEAYAHVLQYAPEAKRLEVRPDEFFRWYGRALLHSNRPDDAVVQLKRSVEILPAAETFLELGNAYADMGETEHAMEAWQNACDRDPVAQDARQALANSALQSGDANTALKWLQPIAAYPRLRSGTTYLFQRAYRMLGDQQAADKWQQTTESLRKSEQVEDTIANILVDDPNSYWAQVIRAHRFAALGNWEEAEATVRPLVHGDETDPFVMQLARAIGDHGEVPPITQIPLKKF